VGATVFTGAIAASAPLNKDAQGLSMADRWICSVFKGKVCLSVAALTEEDQAKIDLIGFGAPLGLEEFASPR